MSCASKLTQCAVFISNATFEPDTSCCNSIKDAVANDLSCLCTLYTTPGLLPSFNINVADALRVSRDSLQILSCASKLMQCTVFLSNATSKPDTLCCNSIKDKVANDLSCLCTLNTMPDLLAYFNINIADALRVSRDCNVNTDLSTCNTQQIPSCSSKLTKCAVFISNTTSKPDTSCCNSIKDAVANDLSCLCTLYTTPGLLASFNINVADALRVSRDCNVNTDLSTCNSTTSPTPMSPPGNN
ncbi:hypothetical protein QYF36_010693 [Acer negundo]|nr:hypothetical protein QYF36_010693 [Acer negundo]